MRSELLPKHFTIQEAVNETTQQEASRKDVKGIAHPYGGETSASGHSGGMNEVTHDNLKSRGRFSKRVKD